MIPAAFFLRLTVCLDVLPADSQTDTVIMENTVSNVAIDQQMQGIQTHLHKGLVRERLRYFGTETTECVKSAFSSW